MLADNAGDGRIARPTSTWISARLKVLGTQFTLEHSFVEGSRLPAGGARLCARRDRLSARVAACLEAYTEAAQLLIATPKWRCEGVGLGYPR